VEDIKNTIEPDFFTVDRKAKIVEIHHHFLSSLGDMMPISWVNQDFVHVVPFSIDGFFDYGRTFK
jgi:hypothetical protein